jgi:hypothetical protein
MFQIKNKHKFLGAVILVFIIVALIIVNSFVTGDEGSDNTPPLLTSENLKQIIPVHVDSILFSYGLKNEWIKNLNPRADTITNKSLDKYKNSWLIKTVSVPGDLPLSDLNYALTNYLHALKLKTLTFEDARTGELYLEVYNATGDTGSTEAVIIMNENDSLKREAADISLILMNTEKYEMPELKEMLDSPEKFSLVLPIDYKYSDIQSAILESGNDYVLMYSVGLEDDFSVDFREKMPEKDWKSKIRSLSSSFPKAAAVFLTNPEQLFKYEKTIREHFLEYRPDVYRDTVYININTLDGEGGPVDKLYSAILNNSKAGKKHQIYIADFTSADFKYYTQRMYELKKKGYKFVYISNVLKQMKKLEAMNDNSKIDSVKHVSK